MSETWLKSLYTVKDERKYGNELKLLGRKSWRKKMIYKYEILIQKGVVFH